MTHFPKKDQKTKNKTKGKKEKKKPIVRLGRHPINAINEPYFNLAKL